MKRKLALLLAAVMLITAALPMNLLATTYTGLGTTSYVDKGGWITTYGGGTLMLDSNLNAGNLGVGTLYLAGAPTGNISYNNGTIAARASSSTSYPIANNGSGLNLVMTFQRGFTVPVNGASFWLNYDNAYHAFLSYAGNTLLRSAATPTSYVGTATKTYSDILTSGTEGTTGLKYSLNTGTRGVTTEVSGDQLTAATSAPVVLLQSAITAGINARNIMLTNEGLDATPKSVYDAYIGAAATIINASTVYSSLEKTALLEAVEGYYANWFNTTFKATSTYDYSLSSTAPTVGTILTSADDYKNSVRTLDTIFGFPNTGTNGTYEILGTLGSAYDNASGLFVTTPSATSSVQLVPVSLVAAYNGLMENRNSVMTYLTNAYTAAGSYGSQLSALSTMTGLDTTNNTNGFNPVVSATTPDTKYFTNASNPSHYTIYTGTTAASPVPTYAFVHVAGVTETNVTSAPGAFTAAADADEISAIVSSHLTKLNSAMTNIAPLVEALIPAWEIAALNAMRGLTLPVAATNLADLQAMRGTSSTATSWGVKYAYPSIFMTTSGVSSDAPYYVYGDAYVAGLGRSDKKSIGYTIEVQPSAPNQALVTVPAGTVIEAGDILIVPMVMMTVAGGTEVKYQVISNNAELFNSVGLTTISTTSTTSGTTLTVSSVAKQAKGRIYLGDIVIQERSSNRINNGTFYLAPPAGYKFVALSNYAATYSIPFNTETGKSITTSTVGNIADATIIDINDYWATRGVYETNAAGGLAVTLGGLTMNRTAFGNITITGLALEPLSSDAYLFDTLGDSLSVYIYGTASTTGVSTTSVVAAQREDWNVSYTAGTPVVAFSGKSDVPVAEITVEELTLDSWNAKWDTEFTVVDAEGNALDGVKISAVGITATNMSKVSGSFTSYSASYNSSIDAYGDEFQNIGLSDLYSTTPKVYTNTSFPRDGHTFIVSDLYPSTTNVLQKMRLTFELSVEPNFEGEVYIQMAGTAVSNNSVDEITNMGIVKVAEFYPPVSISTSTTEVQIGYQKYDVADVVITENFDLVGSAALEAGKKVQLALGEYGAGRLTDYMYFAPISKTDVTVTGDPNFAMSEVTMVNLAATGAYVNYYTGLTQRALEFTITRKSKTAGAEITITNLGVNIDRDVPNGQYDLLVGGSAITDNWIDPTQNYLYLYDRFDVWGVIEPGYINMITDPVNVVTQNTVTLKSGTNIIQVNGKDEEIPVPVLNVDGRMYVPIRFAAVALNVPDSSIYFDEGSRKVVITTAERIVTFQQDSPVYTINGVELSMNEGGVEAVTFIDPQTNRAYIPVRFLAYALNVSVDYDEETGEAILNAK